MRKSTTEKHITPQIHLEKSCLEMLLNAFVLPTFMLEIQKKKKIQWSFRFPFPLVLIHCFRIRPISLQQAYKILVGFSLSIFLHCTGFLAFVQKTVKYTFVQYMHKKEKLNQPTGALTARFHWWLLHRKMLASHSASCGSVQGCWDLQSQCWNFSAHSQPCLKVSSLKLHPLWCWPSHHHQTTALAPHGAWDKQSRYIAIFPPCSSFWLFGEY